MDNEVYLMHKDIPVAKVLLLNDGTSMRLKDVITPEHMPVGTWNVHPAIKNQRLQLWQTSRCIPKERPNLDRVLAITGVSNASELSFRHYGASLTDMYWYKPIDLNISFADINYINNGFASNIGQIIFTGEIAQINSYDSPDVTTNGCLPKMWIMDKSKNYFLLKGNDLYNDKKTPLRAVGEVFASKVAEELQIEHVDYTFANLNDKLELLSMCPTFIKDNSQEFVPFHQYTVEWDTIKNGGLSSVIGKLGLSNDIDNMLLFDYVIGNVDRHKGNAGIIRNADSLEVIGMAPLFDNGTCMKYDFQTGRVMDHDAKFLYQSQKEELQHIKNFQLVERLDENRLADLYMSTAATGKLGDEVVYTNLERLKERVAEVKEKSLERHKNVSMYINQEQER